MDIIKKIDSAIKYNFSGFGNPIKQCTVGNYTLDVDVREGIQKSIYVGWFEKEETKWFYDTLKPGMTVIDVGASVGYYSFVASSLVGDSGVVYAFEPSAYSHDKFLHNIKKNAIKNIKPYKVGLGDVECELEMFDSIGLPINTENIHAPSFFNQKYQDVPGRSMGLVPVIRLDKFWENSLSIGYVDLVKIDVEGFEPQVLRGMKNMFEQKVVKRIMIEYMQPTELFSEGSDSKIMDDLLKSYGFRIVKSTQYDFSSIGFMGNFMYELVETA